MTTLGPVQLVTFGFGPDATFEGRVLEELATLERSGQIRVLDVLFLRKATDGDVETLDYRSEGMGETLAALLGLGLGSGPAEAAGAQESAVAEADGSGARQFGFTPDDLKTLSEELLPGTAAGFLLLEHLWAKKLLEAVRETGGRPLAEGFLTAEALAPVEAELRAATGSTDGPADSL
ncbi:DUF1269 domain-containing protein [Streptomyces panaciradicis]|uniref:DUF1269 domain-containing protein n=1 Tax=Streptomyces panaciradicis TaxID=1470261 RepID=UPI00201CC232|nr:DUF1269 domain-containing protein [Streptomyces panaciradicis]MCL6669403.1 DUF1269 domain-containing protein [Streptomyces panaciradicis]